MWRSRSIHSLTRSLGGEGDYAKERVTGETRRDFMTTLMLIIHTTGEREGEREREREYTQENVQSVSQTPAGQTRRLEIVDVCPQPDNLDDSQAARAPALL